MNKFIATGNLTKDVEIHYLNTGLACANFDLAISRKFKNSNGNIENEVCYIECKTFGKNAEIASQFLHKGSRVMIDGRLYFDSYKNKRGDTIHKHSVIVEKLEFFNNKDTQTQNKQDHAYNQNYNQEKTYNTQNQIQKQNNTQQNLFTQNKTINNHTQNNVSHSQTYPTNPYYQNQEQDMIQQNIAMQTQALHDEFQQEKQEKQQTQHNAKLQQAYHNAMTYDLQDINF